MTHDGAESQADPRDARFRRQVLAEVHDDGATVALNGRRFRASELLLANPQAFGEAFRQWVSDSWLPRQRELLASFTADKTSRRRYESLRDRVASQTVVAFLGSGTSYPFRYPLWSEFLRGLLQWANGVDDAELSALIRNSGFEDAATRLSLCISARHWDEQLAAEFGPISDQELPRIEAPIQWIPLISPRTVVTTNYDPVIEQVFRTSGVPFEKVLYGRELGRFRDLRTKNKRCLLKIHGDHENPQTRVLTREEYDRAYAKDCDGRRELELLFQNHSMLFVGCSLASDRTMDLLDEIARTDHSMPAHFALMLRPNSHSEWLQRDRFLTERGIATIWYSGEHDAALEALLGMLAFEARKMEAP